MVEVRAEIAASANRALLDATLGACLLGAVFSRLALSQTHFWTHMAVTVLVLNLIAVVRDREFFRILAKDFRTRTVTKILLGSVSAVLLYSVFFLGKQLLLLMQGGFMTEIASVYRLKVGHSAAAIFAYLVWIGVAEELFWRHHVQRLAADARGTLWGIAIQALGYTAPHVLALNIPLLVGAFVAGVFWGVLYARWQSALVNAVSHVLWDWLVFILLPLG